MELENDIPYIEQNLQIKNKLSDMEVGDIIPCRYTVLTVGEVGYFSELGYCDRELVDLSSATALPDGKFYFVKVDRNKLIADRNIQRNIKWNTINTKDIIDKTSFSDLYGVANTNNTNKILQDVTSNQTEDGVFYGSSENNTTNEAYFNCFISDETVWWDTGNTDASNYIGYKITNGTNIKINGFKVKKVKGSSQYYPKSIKIEVIKQGEENFTTVFMGENFKPDVAQFFSIKPISCTEIKVTIGNYSSTQRRLVKIELFNSDEDISITSYNISVPKGGVAHYDNDTLSYSLENKNGGGYPKCNDWDTYVCKSNLNGKITPSDDEIWNYSTSVSWCRETVITGVKDLNGATNVVSDAYNVTGRGGSSNLIDDSTAKILCTIPTSNTNTVGGRYGLLGFRPMLILKGGD